MPRYNPSQDIPPKYGDDRNEIILKQLEDVHQFAVPIKPFTKNGNEVLLDSSWSTNINHDSLKTCLKNLKDFFLKMSCPLNIKKSNNKSINLNLNKNQKENEIEIIISEHNITITASTVSGIWQGTIWMEREIAYRHACTLPSGTKILTQVQTRITTSMLSSGFEKASDKNAYTDAYLLNMVHLGYTHVFMYINLWEHCSSQLLPELHNQLSKKNLQDLNKLNQRMAAFGLNLILLVNAPRISSNHKLFNSHPELKGGIVMREEGHALCTSHPLTLNFHKEQIKNITSSIPSLGGLAFLIGGEGFLHCYTRPVPRTEKASNCSVCSSRGPVETLVPLLNNITRSVQQYSPETEVYFWPYSSYIWQNKPVEKYNWDLDKKIIQKLHKKAHWILECEKDGFSNIQGIGKSHVRDYSIQMIEPSKRFLQEEKWLKQNKITMIAKTEVNIATELHSVPYIPVMYRWLKRMRYIQKSISNGTWESWRFVGFWPSPSSELVYWCLSDPTLTDQDILERVASRLYGKTNAYKVLKAWEAFSKSWDTFHQVYGDYWFGPLILGPAHPFFMGTCYALSAKSHSPYSEHFYQICPGLRETESNEFINDSHNRGAKFFAFASPYARERVRDLKKVLYQWKKGLTHLKLALSKCPRELQIQAQQDFDIATTTMYMIESDIAFNTFVTLRNDYQQYQKGNIKHQKAKKEILAILHADLVRCEDTRDMMKRTPMIGWGYTYGIKFNESMLKEKAQLTRSLINQLK